MLVGICGKKRAGKDTVASILLAQRSYKRAAFADKLKAAAAKMFGFSDVPEDAREKETICWVSDLNVLEAMFDLNLDRNLIKEYLKHFHLVYANHIRYFTGTGCQMKISPRVAWQLLGTEFARAIDPNIWINALDISEPLTVVTDVRFDNEAELIKRNGGVIFRVENPRLIDDATAGHASEVPIDKSYVDAVLVNDGTIPELAGKVKILMEQFDK